MNQQYITFRVKNQRIIRTDDFFVVGGSQNYLHARFECCPDWDGEQIIAVFTSGGRGSTNAYRQPVVDGECVVPWEVLRERRFYVGLQAGSRITSNAAEVEVCPCGVPDDTADPQPATPGLCEQMLKKASELDERIRKLEDGGTGGGSSAAGLPPGGKAGQVLTKASDADGDIVWADPQIPPEYGLVTYYQDRRITVT